MSQTKLTVFTVLHILGTCALILIFVTFVGCKIDDEVFEEDDIPTSIAKLQQALLDAAPDPSHKHYDGSKVTVQTVAKAYTGEYQFLGKDYYEVRDKDYFEETSGNSTIGYDLFSYYHEKYNARNELELAREGDCRLIRNIDGDEIVGWYPECTIKLPPFQDQLYVLTAGFLSKSLSLFETTYNVSPQSVTAFYNLKTYKKRIQLPEKMVEEGRCYDFKNCQLITDVVEFTLKSGGDRVHVTLHFSKDLPYLASNISRCELQVISNVPYTICNSVIDFVPGEADSN